MTQAYDGGQIALAGYLYQVLGSVALAAEVLEPRSDSHDDTTAYFKYVELECHGQDARVVSVEENAREALHLVQFKYSGQPQRYPIEPNDLNAILQRFKESAAEAKRLEPQPVSFRLVTNRKLAMSAQKIIDTGKECRGGEQPDAMEANSSEYRSILERLDVEFVDEERFRKVIAERARGFGMLDEELSSGVTRLIGTFFQRAASTGSRSITAPALDEALAGFPMPRRLTDGTLNHVLLDGITEKKKLLRFPRQRLLPREDVVQDPLFSSRALVVLCGEGGTGKSVAACQILERALRSAIRVPPPFAAMNSVHELTESWVAELVSNWRNSNQRSHSTEPIDTAIARLIAAASGTPPILRLALDGIDEVGPRPEYRAIGQILRFFRKEDTLCRAEGRLPRAVLLVTCRDPEEVYSNWIDLGCFAQDVDTIRHLRLTQFSNPELRQIADLVLESSVASRIRRAIEIGGSDRYRDPRAVAGDMPRAALPEVVEALRHPGLWRFFSEDFDQNEQHMILDGEHACLDRLCRSFVDWLCKKAERRKHAIPSDTTRTIVRTVASLLSDPGQAGRLQEDWVQPAHAATGCAEMEARQVFREAASLGLVIKVEGLHWKWKHPFMCEYLANLDT